MHQSKPRPHRPPTTMPTRRSVHDAELVDSMTDLLDEIDNILEENVVRHAFRQKGGQ